MFFWFDLRLSHCTNKQNRNAILVRYRPLRRDVHVSSVGVDFIEPNRFFSLGGTWFDFQPTALLKTTHPRRTRANFCAARELLLKICPLRSLHEHDHMISRDQAVSD